MFTLFGITGNVGSATAQTLLASGKKVRGVVRDKSKAAHLAKQGVELVTGDFTDPESMVKAMEGAEGVFVMNPPNFAPRPGYPEARAILASIHTALAEAKPPKAVYLSSGGSHLDRGLGVITPSHILEESMKQIPIANAFIRGAWFFENYQSDVQSAREAGQIDSFFAPVTKEFPMVSTQDVGDLAAKTLLENWKGNRVMEIEGPKRYSPLDAAEAFSKALGREVTVRLIPRSQWQEKLVAQGTPADRTGARIEMIEGANSGWIEFENVKATLKGVVTIEDALHELVTKPSQS